MGKYKFSSLVFYSILFLNNAFCASSSSSSSSSSSFSSSSTIDTSTKTLGFFAKYSNLGSSKEYNLPEIAADLAGKIDRYHQTPKDIRVALRDRIEALKEIERIASQKGIKDVDEDATSKVNHLNALEAKLTEMGYTPDGKCDFRRLIFWYLKNYVGISSHGIGITEYGAPLVSNAAMSSASCIGEFLNQYSDPLRRELHTVANEFSAKNIGGNFLLWLETQSLPSDHIKELSELITLKVKKGLLVDSKTGNPISIQAIYIMDSDGNIHVGLAHHHPRFTWAKPVICGGYIEIKEGKIQKITYDSGHYRPTLEHFYYCLKNLFEKGVLADDAQVSFMLGLNATDTIMTLVKIGTSNLKIDPNAKPFIDYYLANSNEKNANPMFIEWAKQGVVLSVGYGIEMQATNFLAIYRMPTGKDSWRQKVIESKTYVSRDDPLLEIIMKIVNNDSKLKQMIVEEMFKQKAVQSKVEIFAKNLK